MANDFGQQSSPFRGAGETNPYQATAYSEPGFSATATVRPSLPAFVIVMMVFSLVLCVIRVLLAMLGVATIAGGFVPNVSPIAYTGLAINFIGAAVGIGAGGLILARRASGIPLAWIHVAGILISIGINVHQAFADSMPLVPTCPMPRTCCWRCEWAL